VLGSGDHSVGVQLVEVTQAFGDARAPFIGKTLHPVPANRLVKARTVATMSETGPVAAKIT